MKSDHHNQTIDLHSAAKKRLVSREIVSGSSVMLNGADIASSEQSTEDEEIQQ